MIRRPLGLYIAAGIAAAACRPRLAPVIPTALAPVSRDSAVSWVRRILPPPAGAMRFRWRYQDERVRWSGRGTVRLAPPDSLRLDYAGPLGLGAGAGVVVGDSVLWAEPAAEFERLVPAIPLLWAALGTVRPPDGGGEVFTGGTPDGRPGVRYWRFVQGGDTLDYALSIATERVLEAEWRRGGRVVARSRTEYDGSRPRTSRIDFPMGPARIEFAVVARDSTAVLPPALWRNRR
ncbi:MAG TPA: hypothetical protein VNI61_03620 [Gemmatimonadales bacterium]|nr:hypothetical protein [Gemmatimonadales bacterium]